MKQSELRRNESGALAHRATAVDGSLKGPSHKTRIMHNLQCDMMWWVDQVTNFNGTLRIIDSRTDAPLYIDACMEGGAGYFGGEWFYVSWNHWPRMATRHIKFKEVILLEVAAHILAPCWANKKISVYCDSQAAVGMVNKGHAPDADINESLRRVYWFSA